MEVHFTLISIISLSTHGAGLEFLFYSNVIIMQRKVKISGYACVDK